MLLITLIFAPLSTKLLDKRKVLLTHVYITFNKNIQEHYNIVYIRFEEYKILNILDMSNNYIEREVLSCRSAKNLSNMIKSK